ncbi:hypothetical protein FB451DRAFT_1181280 [Mycena latifolia]|nr:hypothetical protein FB451DRAFT_1181280 [Mycena latifolia]
MTAPSRDLPPSQPARKTWTCTKTLDVHQHAAPPLLSLALSTAQSPVVPPVPTSTSHPLAPRSLGEPPRAVIQLFEDLSNPAITRKLCAQYNRILRGAARRSHTRPRLLELTQTTSYSYQGLVRRDERIRSMRSAPAPRVFMPNSRQASLGTRGLGAALIERAASYRSYGLGWRARVMPYSLRSITPPAHLCTQTDATGLSVAGVKRAARSGTGARRGRSGQGFCERTRAWGGSGQRRWDSDDGFYCAIKRAENRVRGRRKRRRSCAPRADDDAGEERSRTRREGKGMYSRVVYVHVSG